MKVKISHLIGSTLPKYQTADSAGFDISPSVDSVIAPGSIAIIPTGLIIEAPPGYFLMISARSSLSVKKGLMLANGIGIIDRDFAGPNDEIKLLLYNFTQQPVEIKSSERLAQGIFVPFATAEWEEVGQIRPIDRGGIGHSGGYIKE